MSAHQIETSNSIFGTITSVSFAMISIADTSEIVRIVAGLFAIAASAVTIYYTVKNNRKNAEKR